MSPTVHILILAAGASSRMRGADKLLQPIAGQPILRRLARVALATGAPVYVTLPPDAMARSAAIADLGVSTVEIPDAAEGMSRSLMRGVAAVAATNPAENDGMMILPADMPGFTTKALTNMIVGFRAAPHLIWRGASADGHAGHPAIFPRDLWTALAAVTGDEGGRSVLKTHKRRVQVMTLPGEMATLDLDTPEDWAAYLGHPT